MRRSVGLFALLIAGYGAAWAQAYPTKPIRMVTHPPGGSSDPVARLIAQGISESLGQQVIVDNRGGIIAPQTVARALPDGYTLLLFGTPFWISPLVQDNVSYDPVKDFAPITVATSSPSVLVVNPSVAAKSVKELISLAKSKPGQLNYASGAAGSANHLAAELFKSMADVDIVRIPYNGAGPALTDVIAGRVQLMFPNATAVIPHIKSGKMRALAITSATPSALMPDLVTVSAAGLPGYESASILSILAPAKVPEAIINRLNREIVRFLGIADVRERLLRAGSDVIGSTPRELTVTMKSEMTRTGKVIKNAGIRAE